MAFLFLTLKPMLKIVLTVLLILAAAAACTTPEPTATPSPAETPAPMATATPTDTPVPTATPTAVPTATQTPTPIPTAEPISLPAFEPDICRFLPAYGYEKECGYLIVPQDRSQPDGPTIRIHVAIFKSTSPNPAPDPVIYIAGGGGTNQLDSHEYYLAHGGNDILKSRDYIMFNQRGAPYNEPWLGCPGDIDLFWRHALRNVSQKEHEAEYIEFLLDCHDDLLEQGINLSAYNTAETAADVNDLRIALGYEQVNLYGTSSGSRTALTVMRYHPEGVRSAILDSVFPPQATIDEDFAPNVYRALKAVFESCAADPYCSETYPDLEATFLRVADELNANPVKLELSRGMVSIDGSDFVGGLCLNLYSSRAIPSIPQWIEQASRGDLGSLQGAFEALKSGGDTGLGVQHSMLCHEEIPFESYERSLSLAADLPPQFRDAFVTPFEFDLCESWQSGQADPIENTAVVSDIPVLILAGEYDPVTPPAWGRLAAETLSNSFFYEFPGLAHGIMRSNECGLEIGLQFIQDPTTEPDASCIDELVGPDFR